VIIEQINQTKYRVSTFKEIFYRELNMKASCSALMR